MAWAYFDDVAVQEKPLAPRRDPELVCHIDDGTERSNLCLAADHPGFVTCETPGLRFVVCPDCGLPVCWRCRELGLLWCSLRMMA